MILLVHAIFGAAVGSLSNNIFLAIILAFSSHYFLDFLPHVEYTIKNIELKKWQKTMPNFLVVALDLLLGILLILFFSKNQILSYVYAFFALLPDGLSFLQFLIKNKALTDHSRFHQKKVHFLKDKKISTFWRILSQIAIILISIAILKF